VALFDSVRGELLVPSKVLAVVAWLTAPLERTPQTLDSRPPAARYLMPITIESGPTSGSTRVAENPAAVIQPAQSAPV
jgi:hypothetical protein